MNIRDLISRSIRIFAFSTVVGALCCFISKDAHAGFFHETEVYTSLKISKGFRVENSIYFLASYKLYQPAKGIAAFPDGGTPKYRFNKTYLYRFDTANNNFSQLAVLQEANKPGNNVLGAMFISERQKLYIAFHVNSNLASKWSRYLGYIWDIPGMKGRVVRHSEKEAFFEANFKDYRRDKNINKQFVSIGQINRHIGEFEAGLLNLPSPLEFCSKSDKEYMKDLVLLRADNLYRSEIISKFKREENYRNIKSALKKMREREEDLRGVKKMEYKIYSSETKKKLADSLPK